ncbi:MAG: hypothetical protein U5K31_00315 [Balneolaceae bacterium]|nr:hypothetical protein [Balneolaceae bacterium]
MTATGPSSEIAWFRRFLLGLSALVFAGTIPELIFSEHTGSLMQWLPFVLCGAGLASVAAVWFRATPSLLKSHRLLMVLITAGGAFGVYEHLYHNYLFEVEIRPSAGFWEAMGHALFGSSPLLAPGILTLGAVLALAFTWRHPLLEGGGASKDAEAT